MTMGDLSLKQDEQWAGQTSRGWKIGTSYSLANPIDLHEVKRSGLECIELTWQPLDLFDPEIKARCDEVVTLAKGLGLEIWSLHIPFGTDWDPSSLDPDIREHAADQVRRVLGCARDWGIRTAVYHPSWEPVPEEERAMRLETARRTLGQLARDAAAVGVRLAAECLPRTCLGHSADEMAFLTEGCPELGVCCDVNHLFKEKPQQFIERLGDRIVTTHISDNDGTDERHWMPGEGVIEWQEVLQALTRVGYRGAIMHEVRNPEPARLMENWRRLAGGMR
jgi:sugar phosphate isomerase/epimerase